ncbi:hypothetical protein PR202_gb16849 [Eleusine coracana subsp. coracana]|uniref:DUF1618 domain-containing protein n=1 Tax=Eleusine coracana subsp. coracana TaxID=191504 RepID=A0AAV5F1F4_ELECO|nr:hypothetical protein PR202_gb16849 [Eleusine coracana subsp. coracana]
MSGSDGKWMVFNNVHIRGANGGSDLDWWSTDAVVPYRSRFLIWVDYYRGAIFADFAHYPEKKKPDLCSGIKFVSVDTQSCSNFGVGHWKWTCTFRITTWSLLLDDDGYTSWRKDARLCAEQLWDLDPKNRFPHITPEFPIVNMENPNVVCFMVDNDRYGSTTSSARACMVEIDMKNKALLAVTDYSRDGSLFGLDSTKFATDLPRYLYAGEKATRITS